MPVATESDTLLTIATDPTAPMVIRTAKNTISDDALTIALADLVQSTYPGYAAITLPDFGLTEEEDDAVGDVLTDNCIFEASELIVTPEPITMIYITRDRNDGPQELCEVIILEEPFIMEKPGQQFVCNARASSFGLVGS